MAADKISGYDLAEYLYSKGGVAALVQYAGRAETDWLELKAGMCLQPEDVRKNETPKDLYWNYAREIIAFMNTSGGVLIIGIQDRTLQYVPLEDNDPKHLMGRGPEVYIREFVKPSIWPRELAWTSHGKIQELSNKQLPSDVLTWCCAPYTDPFRRTGEVVLIFVKPVDQVRLVRSGGNSYPLFKRTKGNLGEAVPIFDPDLIDNYKATREIASIFYVSIRNQFDQDQVEATADAEINRRVEVYYRRLAENAHERMAVFTPLDAEENAFVHDAEDMFYSPEAVEISEDDDWLNGDENDYDADDEDEDDDLEVGDGLEEGRLQSEMSGIDRRRRKGDLLGLLKDEYRVIVSGEPGGGKTTCLIYYTLQFAKNHTVDGCVAIFVPMGQWRRGGSLESIMQKVTGLDNVQLAHLIEKKRIRLIIDAVNECPDDFRVAAIQNIGFFLRDHTSVSAVISTRNPSELQMLRLPCFHVEPMDERHRRSYLGRYLGDPDLAERLLAQIAAMPGGATIAENPMLLRLVVEVYRESPGHQLPDGRAGLYRRSLHSWYRRERVKSDKSGDKLPWQAKEALELLAKMAYQSRLLGFRDVPIEEVQRIWGEKADALLNRLCQGPVICRDSEFLRFRHETFQEYLCAEYLLIEPTALDFVTEADYSKWGMPIAYAVELEEQSGGELDGRDLPIPEPLWCAAWSLNPWLGVALTAPEKGLQLLRRQYRGIRPMVKREKLGERTECGYCGGQYLRCVCQRLTESCFWKLLRTESDWYSKHDASLRYVVSVSRIGQRTWQQFELQQIQFIPKVRLRQAVMLSKNWLTLLPRDVFRRYALESWKGWIGDASLSQALEMVDVSLASAEDFIDKKEAWLSKLIKVNDVPQLLNSGLYSVEELKTRAHLWAQSVDIKNAGMLVANGLISKEDIADRISGWIASAHVNQAIALLECNLATREDFFDRRHQFVEEAMPNGLVALRKYDLASVEDCTRKVQGWLKTASPVLACEMLEFKLCEPSDFKGRPVNWCESLSLTNTIDAIKHGLFKKEQVARKITSWVATASPKVAIELISNSLASPSDFDERFSKWIQTERYSYVGLFVCKYATERMRKLLLPKVGNWISLADCDSAKYLIFGKLASPKDFADKLFDWMENKDSRRILRKSGIVKSADFAKYEQIHAAIDDACEKLNKGIASSEAYITQLPTWVKLAGVKTAFKLVRSGLATRDDFSDKIPKWISTVTLPDALKMINYEFALKTDFAERVPGWASDATLDEAVAMLDASIAVVEDFASRVPDWIGCATEKSARRMIKFGFAKRNDFEEAFRDVCFSNAEQLATLRRGCIKRGRITRVADFGAFVDMGGVSGLLRFANMGRKIVKHLHGFLQVDQEVEVEILDVDLERERISLGLKQIVDDPWNGILERYPVGTHVVGKVVKLAGSGAFVEIARGVRGFVSITELSWAKHIEHASEMLAVGEEIRAVVLSVDIENRLVSLGIRQEQENPRNVFLERFPVGSKVKGKIRNFTTHGAIVELEGGFEGVIDITDMSWARKINHPAECFQKGQEVEAVVLCLNPNEQYYISLGLKQIQEDPWPKILRKYLVGTVIKGRVVHLTKFGAFVRLEAGVDGLIYRSQISEAKIERVTDVLSVGQEVVARVIRIDRDNYRIELSITAVGLSDNQFKSFLATHFKTKFEEEINPQS